MVPDRLRKVCLKALAKVPDDRYVTVLQFAAALREAVQADASTHVSDQITPAAKDEQVAANSVNGKMSLLSLSSTLGSLGCTMNIVISCCLLIGTVAVGKWSIQRMNSAGQDIGKMSEVSSQGPFVADGISSRAHNQNTDLIQLDPDGATTVAANPNKLQLNVKITHFRLNAQNAIAATGDLMSLGAPHENDFVRWDVIAGEAAHFQLFALNPDGVVQICDSQPAANGLAEEATAGMTEYNFPKTDGQGWQLTDGTGQQAFVLLAGVKPLPSVESLVDSLRLTDWNPTDESGAWIFQAGKLQPLHSNALRGGQAPLPGKASFQSICQGITSRFPNITLEAVSFPVQSGLRTGK